ncbi:LysR family transcriptional regulator [Rhizobacter sp. J219]|uniref:LysR family transcriptional regulator n=1 Tax=Rhizobacter sp. J219 TaxID=2898430 RepID=UPI00215161DA|nr:LysR family transcriptional regulator [Rhizobacter sp. J219]MCR5884838.1 LysR family transcriptional regulator [Rhizobacter sp. J219]
MARETPGVMLGSIELFCAAAELESFTAAATQAGVTPAAVSRAVGRLEERLAVPLFVRSTRRMRLTDAGRAYHAQCRQALAQIVEAGRELAGRQVEAAGVIRISAPTTFGHAVLLPLLPAFRKRYPKVSVEVQVSNRNVDFTEERFDLAIRARTPPDSGLVARRLIDAELVVAGAPSYLRKAGKPKSLQDLAAHECIQFVLPRTGQKVAWEFRDEGRDVQVETAGHYTVTDDVLATLTLARAGAGLVQTHRFLMAQDLADGTLVEVLQRFGGRSRPFSVLYAGTRHMPLRVRLFIDFLVEQSQRLQPEGRAGALGGLTRRRR